MFYDKYVQLCNKCGKKPTVVAEEIGLNKSSATGWKRGSTPTDATIAKLCDYFGVPSDYFAETKKDPSTMSREEIDDETYKIMEQIRTRPEMRALFHAADGTSKGNVLAVADMLERMKNNNAD